MIKVGIVNYKSEFSFTGLWNFGPKFVNSNSNPSDSGTISISEKSMAASTPKSLIGSRVTLEARDLSLIN